MAMENSIPTALVPSLFSSPSTRQDTRRKATTKKFFTNKSHQRSAPFRYDFSTAVTHTDLRSTSELRRRGRPATAELIPYFLAKRVSQRQEDIEPLVRNMNGINGSKMKTDTDCHCVVLERPRRFVDSNQNPFGSKPATIQTGFTSSSSNNNNNNNKGKVRSSTTPHSISVRHNTKEHKEHVINQTMFPDLHHDQKSSIFFVGNQNVSQQNSAQENHAVAHTMANTDTLGQHCGQQQTCRRETRAVILARFLHNEVDSLVKNPPVESRLHLSKGRVISPNSQRTFNFQEVSLHFSV